MSFQSVATTDNHIITLAATKCGGDDWTCVTWRTLVYGSLDTTRRWCHLLATSKLTTRMSHNIKLNLLQSWQYFDQLVPFCRLSAGSLTFNSIHTRLRQCRDYTEVYTDRVLFSGVYPVSRITSITKWRS